MRFWPTRIDRESRTVLAMIRLFCRKHGHPRAPTPHGQLCPACAELAEYALERLRRCPFGEGKTTCVKCPVHCYRPAPRERIRAVMRFSGPRMLARHPILTLWHLLDGRRTEPLGGERIIARLRASQHVSSADPAPLASGAGTAALKAD